jgi:hypothetical protein
MLAFLQLYQGYISQIVRFCIPTFAMLALWVGFWRAGLSGNARVTGFIESGLPSGSGWLRSRHCSQRALSQFTN